MAGDGALPCEESLGELGLLRLKNRTFSGVPTNSLPITKKRFPMTEP